MNRIAQLPSKVCLSRLLAEYQVVITGTRFYSRQQKRIKRAQSIPFLREGTKTIRETKLPSGSYLETKLSDDDINLIGRNDFTGVTSLDEKVYKKLTPENAFSLIMEQSTKNKRVHAEFFMVNVLLQLENRNADLKTMLLRKIDFYVPFLISCCGHAMADLHKNSRQTLLDRLVAALELNEIPFSLETLNSILKTKLENDTLFDVGKMLNEVDHKLKLQPDITFFNCLFWQLAKTGKVDEFSKLRNKCVQRGIQFNNQTELAEIYLFERRGISLKSDALMKRYEARYGTDSKYDALGAACCGAAKGRYIDRLRILLRQSLCSVENTEFYDLKIPRDDIFTTIWLLSENGKDGMGKEWSTLAQQILEHAARTHGFFKALYSEIERHINHGYFYSAVELFQDMYRLRASLESQNRTHFVNQIFGRLANKMISNKLDSKVITELGNRMVAFFGIEARFYDNILLAILSYRKSLPMDKFDQFRTFIDMVDPERERIHLILPLIASCDDLVSRCKMLYRCSTLGYKNIADLNPYFINKKLFSPIVEKTKMHDSGKSDWQSLQSLADSLKSYGIPMKDIWLLYLNLLKENQLKGHLLAVDSIAMKAWLKDNEDICFPKPNAQLEAQKAAMDYRELKKLVLDSRNVEKVHQLLIFRGFPSDTNFEEITEPLLYLYIETANWGYLQKLLQMLSTRTSKAEFFNAEPAGNPQKSESTDQPIKNYHLLYILRRKLDELPVDANFLSIIEYVYELKRLFPSAIADQDTFFDTIAAYRHLFYALTQSSQQGRYLDTLAVEQIIELLTVLVRLEMINLHVNETLTPFIISRVYNGIGWNAAVETWMNFQTAFHCSNGILELFRQAIKTNNTHGASFVAHKAKMFISPAKVTVFRAAAHILMNQTDEAAQILSANKDQIDLFDVVSVFRLGNALSNTYRRPSNENFPLNFMKICLDHTDLAKDEKSLQACHADWIRICERKTLGEFAISFVELFKSYGVGLSASELESVQRVINDHNHLINKWITGREGVLNLEYLEDSPTARNDTKLQTIKRNVSKPADEVQDQSIKTRKKPAEKQLTN